MFFCVFFLHLSRLWYNHYDRFAQMCLVISNLSGERYGLWISTYIGKRQKLIEDLF